MNDNSQELKFPVTWNYHIITVAEKTECRSELQQIFTAFDKNILLGDGRVSGGGKYQSYHASATFADRIEMETLSTELSKVTGVKFLL